MQPAGQSDAGTVKARDGCSAWALLIIPKKTKRGHIVPTKGGTAEIKPFSSLNRTGWLSLYIGGKHEEG